METLSISPHLMCQHLLEQVRIERLIIGVVSVMDLPERTRGTEITLPPRSTLPQKQDQDAAETIS